MNHQQVTELLPWYVNATLPPEDRDRVKAHLKECAECVRELERAIELKMAVTEAEIPEPSPFQFTRALARVEEYEREKAGQRWWQVVPQFARVAMVAQLVLIVVFGALLVRRTNEITTATPPSAGPRIVIGFQDGVTEATVRDVVLGIRGQIVDGPSALGLYTIETNEQDIPKVIERLQQNQRVIRIAALAP